MCGIAGLISLHDSDEQRRVAVARRCDALQHRGPDDHGDISRGPATLGTRRLAIIDPTGGHQPITRADGRYHLVFNGCICNYRALRAELAAGDYPFRSQCDTEVLVAAFARHGETCLRRLACGGVRRRKLADFLACAHNLPGFTLPLAVWMRRELTPLLEDTFAPESIGRTGLLVVGAVTAFWRGFLAGREDREWSRFWSLAVLVAFLNHRSAA
jgi:hypothetical protein